MHNIESSDNSYSCSPCQFSWMKILFKNQYSIFATRISWADFNDIEQKFKNSGEPYLDQLFLIKRDASRHSKEAPANSMIFEISFENHAAFARDSPESRFQAKQISLPTFTKHDFGTFRSLALFKFQSSNVIKKIICLGL
jgi:hypothetical protein